MRKLNPFESNILYIIGIILIIIINYMIFYSLSKNGYIHLEIYNKPIWLGFIKATLIGAAIIFLIFVVLLIVSLFLYTTVLKPLIDSYYKSYPKKDKTSKKKSKVKQYKETLL